MNISEWRNDLAVTGYQSHTQHTNYLREFNDVLHSRTTIIPSALLRIFQLYKILFGEISGSHNDKHGSSHLRNEADLLPDYTTQLLSSVFYFMTENSTTTLAD